VAEREVPIAGMTCAACEDTVSRSFLALPGIDSVTASSRTGIVRLVGAALPSDAALADTLVDTPYRLGNRPWLAHERSVWTDLAVGAAVVAALFFAISAWNPGSRVGGLTAGLTVGSALVVLGLGVAASLSTCMALVGGLVLSLSASVRNSSSRKADAVARQAAFNIGRVVGFGGLGAVAGVVGQAFALRGLALAISMMVVAVATAILGLRLTEVSPRLAALQVTLPRAWASWAKRVPAAGGTGALGETAAQTADGIRPQLRAAGLGAATFFLPCGFTQVVQLLAISSGSPVTGGALMALFALGTAPGLFAVGVAAASARGTAARRPLRVVGLVVIAFAVVTGLGGLTGAGLLTPRVAALPTERTANVVDVDGRQLVTTDVALKGYFPADAVVYVDEPVTWVLNPVGAGCASIVNADSLGLGQLNAIFTKVSSHFTPTKTGTFRYQCAMGMYSGSITVIDRPVHTS